MDHKKKPCNCVRECPCYPRCDEMMEQNQMLGGHSPMPPHQMPVPGIPQDWWRGPQMPMQQPVPGWGMQQPPMPGQLVPWMQTQIQPDVEVENDQDWEKIKELYPEMAKMILSKVEDACDKMEYEGSAMFDMMPDKNRVRNMAGEIQKMLEEQIPAEQVEEMPDLYTMNQAPCRNCRPNQNFLGDFIEVMLYQEMHRRRCRHRRCRRW